MVVQGLNPSVAWERSSKQDDSFRLLVTGPSNAEEDGNICKVVFPYYIAPEKKNTDIISRRKNNKTSINIVSTLNVYYRGKFKSSQKQQNF